MRLTALLFVVFVFPLSVGAHAFGVSHETTVDGIHIDIGYSSAAPVVGESVIFDFNLPVGEEDEEYTDVWVRIEGEKGNVVLATAVHNAEFGGPRMSYVFPSAGTYTISVRYEEEGAAVVKTEWSLVVLPATGSIFTQVPWYGYLFLGIVLGAGALRFLPRMLKKRA